MTFSVSSFSAKANSQGLGLARANQFSVVFTDLTDSTKIAHGEYDILVKATQFPGSTITPMPVSYGGRIIKLTGFRTFDNWTVTILNDEDFRHRRWVESWMYELAGLPAGDRSKIAGAANKTHLYKKPSSAKVVAANNQGEAMGAGQFYNIWPTALGDITLDWGTDAIEEYTVEFAYEYWTQGHHATTPDPTGSNSKTLPANDVNSAVAG